MTQREEDLRLPSDGGRRAGVARKARGAGGVALSPSPSEPRGGRAPPVPAAAAAAAPPLPERRLPSLPAALATAVPLHARRRRRLAQPE
ncbi:Hypothetical predicted protein [Podarcis lilfordi]|uniref:Uncharacterized protein n=1 Tax=Podarcis lilfordi TaxID=74358 RepID=A0AA35KWB1_9SAUR|nr:Hypothetical predicted protein [Podarcis lilfordi]